MSWLPANAQPYLPPEGADPNPSTLSLIPGADRVEKLLALGATR